jgi:hypothetical protein
MWNIQNVTKLGSEINNKDSEESIPLLSEVTGKFYFVRSTISEGQSLTSQNIFESNYSLENNFSNATTIEKLNNGLNNSILGICKEGKKVYLLDMYNKKKSPGIACSTLENGIWSKPERVEIPKLDVPNTLFGFHISSDEKVIILSYLGPNSIGEEDLYVSHNTEGSWSIPMHLGNELNSKGFEISPFLSSGKDTLFFASNGFGGLGDADIFYSVKGKSWSDWSKPTNLGAPINSSGFDAYFSYYQNQMFWASNRNERLSDIYTAALPKVKPLALEISSTNCSKYNSNDGSLSLKISGGTEPYAVKWMDGNGEVLRTNVKPGNYSVEVTDANGNKLIEKATITEPMEIKEDIVKSYVHYFDYNGVSISEDKKFLELLNSWKNQNVNEKMDIYIVSSASEVPTSKYGSNVKLAEKRAQEVMKIIKKTIPSDRIVLNSEAKVEGPAYENDSQDKDKYNKFQYVKIMLR